MWRQNGILHISPSVTQTVLSFNKSHWGRDQMDAISQTIFPNEFSWMKMYESRLKFVPQGPISNIPGLVQIMAWRLPGDKPLSGPMMVRLPTHICVTRPQWVKHNMHSIPKALTFHTQKTVTVSVIHYFVKYQVNGPHTNGLGGQLPVKSCPQNSNHYHFDIILIHYRLHI